MNGIRWTSEQLEAHQKRREATVVPISEASKYGNVKTGKHASKREAKRAAELRLLEQAGTTRNLREQVKYELIPAQYIDGKCVERAATYTADFVYEYLDVSGGWHPVVEDAKGVRTQQYIIRRKLMLHVHGIRIRET